MAIVSAEGDARLSAEGTILAAWSPDGQYLVFADSGALTVWRAADGSLVGLFPCRRDLGAISVAASVDARWIVASGSLAGAEGSQGATCVVNRASGSTRIFPVALTRHPRGRLSFDPALEHVSGDAADVELVAGSVRPVTRAPTVVAPTASSAQPPPPDLEGASYSVTSHDGQTLAAWTATPFVELSGPDRVPAARDAPFVAAWDLPTGRRRWRHANSDDEDWQFTADDRFLEAPPTRAGHELLRVATGEPLSFPGSLSPVAPSGQRVVVLRSSGASIWAVDPPAPLVVPARSRRVRARSPDGRTSAAYAGSSGVYELGPLVVEWPGACVALGVSPSGVDPVEFSRDGRRLYVATVGQGGAPTLLQVYSVPDGELQSELAVRGATAVYPLPALGYAAFGVPNGVRELDVASGEQLLVAEAGAGALTIPAGGSLARGRVTPNGRFLVGATPDRRMAVWDFGHPREVRALGVPRTFLADPREVFDRVELSPDSAWIAAGTSDGAVGLWKWSGKFVAVAAHHRGHVRELSFSPDGRWLASTGDDGIVIVSDTATGATIGTLSLVLDHVASLAFDRDMRLRIQTSRGFEINASVASTNQRDTAASQASGRPTYLPNARRGSE